MYSHQPQTVKPTPKPVDNDPDIDLDQFDDMVADRFKVPRSLMKAIRTQESGGNPNAVSPTGVRGRYQVTESTAKQYGLDRNDPFQQSVAAAKHLRSLYDSTPGDDDDTRWLGASAKYYGGGDAVKGDEISNNSLDGLSNPSRYVEGIAKKWGELRRQERGQQPQIAVGHSQTPKPLAPIQRKPSTTTRNVFNKNLEAEQRAATQQAKSALDFRPAGGATFGIQQQADALTNRVIDSPATAQRMAAREQYQKLNPITKVGARVAMRLAGASPEEVSQIARPVGDIEQMGQSFARPTVDALGNIIQAIPSVVRNPMMPAPPKQGLQPIADRTAQRIRRSGDVLAPTNPDDDSWITSKIPQAAGSVVPFVAANAATGGSAMAPAALGALQSLGQFNEDVARSNRPVSPVRRQLGEGLAIATGLTEALGIGRMLNKFGVAKPVIERAAQIAEESGQEYAQKYLEDVNARLVAGYDPNRDLSPVDPQKLEAAALGAIVGGGMAAPSLPGDIRAARQAGSASPAVTPDARPAPQQAPANRPPIQPVNVGLAPKRADFPPTPEGNAAFLKAKNAHRAKELTVQPQQRAPLATSTGPVPAPITPDAQPTATLPAAQGQARKIPLPNRDDFPAGVLGEGMYRQSVERVNRLNEQAERKAEREAKKAQPKPVMAASDLRSGVTGLKQEADEAERAGNFLVAKTKYEAAIDNLRQMKTDARKAGNAQAFTDLNDEIKAVNALKVQAGNQAAKAAKRPAPTINQKAPDSIESEPTRDLSTPLPAGVAKTPQPAQQAMRTTQEIPRVGVGKARPVQQSSPVSAELPAPPPDDRLAKLRAAAQQAPPIELAQPERPNDRLERLKQAAQRANQQFASPQEPAPKVAKTAPESPQVQAFQRPKPGAKPTAEPKLSNRVVKQSLQEELGATSTNRSDKLRLGGPSENYREVVTKWDDAPEGTRFTKPEHYGDEANVLFDRRLEDRKTTQGENATFFMEAQSDWHQSKDAPPAPMKNTWLRRALDDTAAEASQAGQDGVLLPKTVEQLYEIQRWGAVKEKEGRYTNSEGFDITPVVRRYLKELPDLARKSARKNGVELETRTVDDGRGGQQELWFLPVKKAAKSLDIAKPVEAAPVAETKAPEVAPVEDVDFARLAEQSAAQRAASAEKPQRRKMTSELSPVEYLKRKTNREGFRVTDKGEARRLGSKESGIVGLTNKRSKWSTHDAQVMLDEGGFTMPDGRAFTDPSVTETDVLSYLENFGKQGKQNTANLDRRLAEEEATYYEQQEESRPRRARPPVPSQPRPVGNRPVPTDVNMSAKFPSARRALATAGRDVQAEIEAGRGESGQYGRNAQQMFKSSSGKAAHGQDSFFHDAEVKGKLGLSADAEQKDVRAAVKRQLARMLRIKANEVSLTQITPDIWRQFAEVKGMSQNARVKMEIAFRRAGEADVTKTASESAAQPKQPETESRQAAPTDQPTRAAVDEAKAPDVAKDTGSDQRRGTIEDRIARGDTSLTDSELSIFGREQVRSGRSAASVRAFVNDALFKSADKNLDDFPDFEIATDPRNTSIEGIGMIRAEQWQRAFERQLKEQGLWEEYQSSRKAAELQLNEKNQDVPNFAPSINQPIHEMTRAEWDQLPEIDRKQNDHELAVIKALKQGKEVSPSVLKDYPNAARRYQSASASSDQPIARDSTVAWGDKGTRKTGIVKKVNNGWATIELPDGSREVVSVGRLNKPEIKVREQRTITPQEVTDTIKDARVEFRSGKGGRPGTVYATQSGNDLMSAAYYEVTGEYRDFRNVNWDADGARQIADGMERLANDPEATPLERRQLRTAAREMRHAANSGETVSVVNIGGARKLSDIKVSRRHEHFHDAQQGLQNSRGFLQKHPQGQKLIDRLAELGYAPEDRTIEAAAFVAGGQAKDFGLTDAEAKTFLKDYFDDIVKTNGREALERFVTMAPKIQESLKEAKAAYDRTSRENRGGNTESRATTERGATGTAGGAPGEGAGIPGRDSGRRQEEARRAKTREDVENSPEFKRWFGDSKVVDEKGKPLVVYHGTASDFDAFDIQRIGSGKGYKSEGGFFFSSSPAVASVVSEYSKGDSGSNVQPSYLSLKNPLTVDADGILTSSQKQRASATAIREGRDGIIFKNVKLADGSIESEYVAFSPNQIKSAIGNRGTFDPTSPRITEQKPLGAARRFIEDEGGSASLGLGLDKILAKVKRTSKPKEIPADWDAQKFVDQLVDQVTPKYRRDRTIKPAALNLDKAQIDELAAAANDLIDAMAKKDYAAAYDARERARRVVIPESRDVKWFDHFTSPLSNLNVKGGYERIGGVKGREISELFRNAQVQLATKDVRRGDVISKLRRDLRPYRKQLQLAGKPGLASWLDNHVAALNDPDASFRGLAGFLKSFHFYTKLAYNPRSAVINWVQPLQTLWPHVSTVEFAKLMRDARNPRIRARVIEAAKRESGGQVERPDDKKFRTLFGMPSESNRVVGHLAGEMFADRLGLTGDAKARMAADWAKKVEFDNSQWDVPPLFRGKIASVVGQFKPFLAKNLERLHADWVKQIEETDRRGWLVKPSGNLARRSKMVVGQVALGGLRSITNSAVVGSIGGVLLLGGLAKALQKVGLDEDDADKLAETIYFGAPGIIGQDLSGSMMILDEPYGDTIEEKMLNYLGGPTLSGIAQIGKQGYKAYSPDGKTQATREDQRKRALGKIAQQVLPKPAFRLGEVGVAAYNKQTPTVQLDKKAVPLSKLQTIPYAVGFTPQFQTEYYDQKDAYDWQKGLQKKWGMRPQPRNLPAPVRR